MDTIRYTDGTAKMGITLKEAQHGQSYKTEDGKKGFVISTHSAFGMIDNVFLHFSTHGIHVISVNTTLLYPEPLEWHISCRYPELRSEAV